MEVAPTLVGRSQRVANSRRTSRSVPALERRLSEVGVRPPRCKSSNRRGPGLLLSGIEVLMFGATSRRRGALSLWACRQTRLLRIRARRIRDDGPHWVVLALRRNCVPSEWRANGVVNGKPGDDRRIEERIRLRRELRSLPGLMWAPSSGGARGRRNGGWA